MSSPPASESARWDARLAAAPAPHLLQSWGWGEVQGRAGWRVHRLWVDGPEGRLPVTALESASGVAAVRGLRRLYVPRGPAVDPRDRAGYARVASALLAQAREVGAVRVDVEAPWEAAAVAPTVAWAAAPPTAPRQPLVTSIVDLSGSAEARLARCHPKTRYNIRLAERRGVTVTEEGGPEALARCLAATASRQAISLPGPRHLAAVAAALGPAARPLFAMVEGEVVSAIVVAAFAGEAIYLYGGTTGRFRERMPNYLLHWHAMDWAVRSGCLRYDLWGVPPTDDPGHRWHGLRQFKLGFGGRTVVYAGSRSMLLHPARARALERLEAAARRLRAR